MTKQLVKYSVAVMTTLLGLAILWQFHNIVVYVLISVTLAAALRPFVRRLVGKSIYVRSAWILLYLFVLTGLGFILYFVGKVAALEIQSLASTISLQQEWTLPSWLKGSLFKQVLDTRLLPPNKLFQIATYGQIQSVLPALLGFTQSIASAVSGIFVTVILSLYWIVSKSHFERLWLSLLPSGQRKQARDVWQTIEPDLGAYIRNQIAINILAGVVLGLGYRLIGSPYPVLLALVGAFVTAIPFVGVVLAVIIPLVVGWITGMQFTPVIVIYTLIVMLALGIWVRPRLFYRRWDNPILTLLLLVALADVFGLVGIVIAPPISAVIQITWSLLVAQRIATESSAQISDFKQRQESVWDAIRMMKEPPPPQVISTMERLNRLIEKAEPILQAAQPTQPSSLLLPDYHQPDQE